MFKSKEMEWLSNYLFFVARKYPYVFIDLLETNIFSHKEQQIMIYRYVNHKTYDEISFLIHLETRQVHQIIQKSLTTLLGNKLH